MTRRELQELLNRLEIRPSARLGQNFLVDPNLRDALLRDAAPRAGETVVEVGPGAGALTGALLDAGVRVVAVELDRRLCEFLRETFGGRENFRLVESDACRLNYRDLLGDQQTWRLIANLPYSAGTVLLAKLFLEECPPLEVLVLLQREVAERLTGRTGTKAYGSLTVRSQVLYEGRQLRVVPGRVFFPEPEVTSSHLRLVRHADIPCRGRRTALARLTRVAFGERRKKLLGVLRKRLPAVDWRPRFAQLSLSAERRAETLSPAEFLALAEAMDETDSPKPHESQGNARSPA